MLATLIETLNKRFDGLDGKLDRLADDRKECRKEHESRVASLEHWRSWMLGAVAVVGGIVGWLIVDGPLQRQYLYPPSATGGVVSGVTSRR